MANVPLVGGGIALIDDADLDLVRHAEWRRFTVAKRFHYVSTRGKNPVLLHRWLMLPGAGLVVDHINGDASDNRRANLRVCTQKQNMQNRAGCINSTSKYKGVYRQKKRWGAGIGGCHSAFRMYIGCFKTEEEAASAYDIAAVLRFGEFACLNFPHVFPEVSSRVA